MRVPSPIGSTTKISSSGLYSLYLKGAPLFNLKLGTNKLSIAALIGLNFEPINILFLFILLIELSSKVIVTTRGSTVILSTS